ncbi:hypothetical protein F511_44267 [Dorcoceras hygrometricum]|uniref:Uncharacterized protein n=1 Tax=Dorcoceras hygrometricum TaxID=472368 RepID=A0A2Z7BFN1_9LAMI|nr:hypothetical protein F511_44267 [Dorcoceras hygrometricum]
MQYAMQSYYKAFRFYRSSVFNILIVISTVFGCPPTKSSPKISKFQNRPKRARYRIPARKLHGLPGTGPNQTLEEFSRHDIAGASPERRPTGGGATRKIARQPRETSRQARRTAARNSSHVARPVAAQISRPSQKPAPDQQRNAAQCLRVWRPHHATSVLE